MKRSVKRLFGIRYMKAGPTQYVLHYKNGRLKRSGTGLSFFYHERTSTIAVIPVGSLDAPFIFNEMTEDYQPVTVQGQLLYQITDPKLVSSLLDFTVQGKVDRYVSDDPEKLSQRLINVVQVYTRTEVQSRPLRKAIQSSDEVASNVLKVLQKSDEVASLGVEILALSIAAIKPSPEISRALEAEAREEILRQADDSIYKRRNAAVEQERLIKENELNTEIAIEEKKRKIRETKVEADLAVESRQQKIREAKLEGEIRLEEERKRLIEVRTENARKEADAQAYAVAAALRPLQELDPLLVQTLALQSGEPRLMVSLALKEIAQNAAKIGHLNITPDLLESLMKEKKEQS